MSTCTGTGFWLLQLDPIFVLAPCLFCLTYAFDSPTDHKALHMCSPSHPFYPVISKYFYPGTSG